MVKVFMTDGGDFYAGANAEAVLAQLRTETFPDTELEELTEVNPHKIMMEPEEGLPSRTLAEDLSQTEDGCEPFCCATQNC